jgi:hypothetical protein
MFSRLLREATEELDPTSPSETVIPVDGGTVTDETGAEEGAEEAGEGEEGSIQKDLQDIITSILDAIEQESLASGETFEDDESVDVGLEILYKLAPNFSEEDAQSAYDALSEYFEMSVEDGAAEEDKEGFEETPAVEGDEKDFEEDKVKTESIARKNVKRP